MAGWLRKGIIGGESGDTKKDKGFFREREREVMRRVLIYKEIQGVLREFWSFFAPTDK